MNKLEKKIVFKTNITVETGLHIGGNSESVEIGGIDCPVIKMATRDNQPYIPGSSLKGKIRCLLEQIRGNARVGGNQEVDNLFGASDPNNPSPSKLIVRDAYLTRESAQRLKNCDSLDMPYTEGKWENTIHRVRGTAEHPRQQERVPAGAEFEAEFIINVWNTDTEDDLVNLLKEGIKAIENDFLGGSGSRGYGKVSFSELRQKTISFS